jgi:cyclopropane-fatty-acyl-phospholipid synthase
MTNVFVHPSSESRNGGCRTAISRGVNLAAWQRLFLRMAARIRVGQLAIVFPGCSRIVINSGEQPDLRAEIEVRGARALLHLLTGGSVGFAEAYIRGDWDSPELARLVELAALNEAAVGDEAAASSLMRFIHRCRHRLRKNTLRGSRRNISAHYDLGNAFYAQWLDESMTYSSALFERAEQPLGEAQESKYSRMATLLDLRPDQHVLEIGCGWGGFAQWLATRSGCRVTGLTLSAQQADFARARIRAAGLEERVAIRMEDYREVQGRYDRIASIEMFEAVGEAHWPAFFSVLRERLVAGGIAAMQVITIDDARFAAYRKCVDFIQHYIFPGGMLPTASALSREIGRAGLRLTDRTTFGASYALTLARWQARFQKAWPQIRTMGFDERFKRTWEYYLAYCEAGFRAGSIDVCQIRIKKPA